MVLDRLKARFRDPLELTDSADAADVFREEREDAMTAAEEELQQLQEEVDEALQELDRRLQELAGYEDVEGRTAVEDVADNIVSDRRRMVDQFSTPDDPAELHDTLDAFVDEFKEMKRKETEVLKLMGEDKKPVFDALDRVKNLRSRTAQFRDGSYQVLERHRTLQDAVNDLQQLRQQREELADELDSIDLASLRQQIDGVENDLDQLHSSETWQDYEALREELEQVREERETVRGIVEGAVTRMERGLKKLLYEAGHGDVSIDADRQILEEIRDGEVDAILGRDPDEVAVAVEAAVDALPGDLLGERQEDKFMDAAETLTGIGTTVERLDELEERIASLEEDVEGHEAPERENELSADLDDLGRELDEARKRRKELRAELEQVKEEREGVEERIQEELDEAFRRDVVSGS